MKHLRTVEDVMTRAAISVERNTAFKDVVAALRMWNVSALPVLDQDGKVAGARSMARRHLKRLVDVKADFTTPVPA
ncbi:CBS domain-containing protein [Streptomyces sp. NBC_01439]|uniref:CBS domain-containing protein n=1 Tax=Streptomyces sp. NBC_01439 TaxID=2903867 RepID=UPI002E29A7FC|nr:CBS domain-containing protein [Streptomyces sp. NBC_01439]